MEAETKDYSVRVVLYTSAENTSKEAEKKEEEIAKKKKTKYFKGLRQVFSGEILLTFKHPMVANTEQFFGKHLQQLLTIDTDYLAKHQKELTDEMRDDFKEMRDRLKTNPDQKRLFDDYGDSYVSGILLLHYKLNKQEKSNPPTRKGPPRKPQKTSPLNMHILVMSWIFPKTPSKRQLRRSTTAKTNAGSIRSWTFMVIPFSPRQTAKIPTDP
jgi:hypothetical protein